MTTSPVFIVAVVASYRPEPALLETVHALVAQFDGVVVVDDGSPSDFFGLLDALEAAGAEVLRRRQNSGIAATLNAGISRAEELWRPDFFVTFDQDSVPVSNFATAAIASYDQALSLGLEVGFVTASSYGGHPVPTLRPSRDAFGPIYPFDPMQSGFVVPRKTFDRVGRFAEDFFIDGVDSEFTARVRRAGLAVIVGVGCDIQHDLGARQQARWFGRPLRVAGRQISFNYHSPQRVYYICRNGTVITLRYALRQPGWVARRLVEEAKAHVLRGLFSPGRRDLARAARRGFVDAVRGKMGPMPPGVVRPPR